MNPKQRSIISKRLNLMKQYVRTTSPYVINYKMYPKNKKCVQLMEASLPKVPLVQTLTHRTSSRIFTKKKLSLADISSILKLSAGENTHLLEYHRYYPSAGKRYPLECYFLSFYTEIQSGAYFYNVQNHTLIRLRLKKNLTIHNITPQFKNVPSPAACIVISTISKRTTQKYGERGKRYPLIEAGHIGQNIQLIAKSLHINSVPMGGGFDEDKIKKILDIRSKSEQILYLFALGYDP